MSLESKAKTPDVIYQEMITANKNNGKQYHKDNDTDKAIKRSKEIDSHLWVPLETAQQAIIEEQYHYADAMVMRDLVLEKIFEVNKILDEPLFPQYFKKRLCEALK